VGEGTSAGPTRRELIRNAAVAGGAAWAAPVIIDSLASPAAAVTVGPCNYYVFSIRRDGNSQNCNVDNALVPASTCASTPSNNIGVCTSYVRQTSSATPVSISVSCTGGATATATFTINTAGCEFQGRASSLTCAAAPTLVAPLGTTTTTVTQSGIPQNGTWFAYLAIAC
jgi:hypothetical protein